MPAKLEKPRDGLFSAKLRFSVDRLMAGTYYLTLRAPLMPNGENTSTVYEQITMILDVKGRVCANSSCVRLQGGESGEASLGTCHSAHSSSYRQGDRLVVNIMDLQDINGLPIETSHSVDLAKDMQLRFCTPGQAPKDCEMLLMSFVVNDLSFSATLPPLSHEGRHTLMVEHGVMVGCLWSTMFHATCKIGHQADAKTQLCSLIIGSTKTPNPLV